MNKIESYVNQESIERIMAVLDQQAAQIFALEAKVANLEARLKNLEDRKNRDTVY